jgi:hypothetical protein
MAKISEASEAKEILEDPYYINVEDRLTTISLYLGVFVAGLLLALGKVLLAGSFLIGAVLSYLNFTWMKQGVDRLLNTSSRAVIPSNRKVILKYFLRYALIGGTLYAIFRLQFLDLGAAVAGLLLFVAAIIYECFYQVIKGLSGDRTRGRT